ncbi:MAG: hypothetical protein IT538_11105 [Variibacter sp.]|nr:hypothetical protein [Variibacter sp.]
MKKLVLAIFGLVAAFGLLTDRASAQSAYPRVVIGPFDLGDARLVVTGVVVGGAMTGTYFAIRGNRTLRIPGDGGGWNSGAFALTTVGCMTLAPMIGSAWVWNTEQRPLTQREALRLGAGCVIPFIGPMISDAIFFGGPER